jgi:ketosteroid isomerase-like protein
VSRSPNPSEVVANFIDCINRGDLNEIAALLSDDHRMVVLDEAALCGRNASIDAWKAYLSSFPDYLIFRRHTTAHGSRVAVLGTTSGSHLGLVPEEEMKVTVIWLAEVVDGRLAGWQVAEDTPELRLAVGFPTSV